MFWNRIKEIRKVRSDDKVHVNPTISVELKEQIERLAFILGQPVNRMGELLFLWGVDEREVNELLAPHFVYGNLVYDNTMFIGHEDNPQIVVTINKPSERISIRFNQDGHHDIELYTDLLGLKDKSKAVTLMMDIAIRHPKIIEDLLRHQNNRYHFDEVVMEETKKLMNFINNKNPYKSDWNQAFLQFLEGTKKRPKNMMRPMTKNCVDTETYLWNFD